MSRIAVIVLSLVLVGVIAASTYAAISVSTTINSSGTIVAAPGIAVCSDSACTVPLTTITWGSLSPGGSTTQTIYVKNTGGSSLTLSISTSNWNPTTANGPLTISWNQAGTVLAPGQSIAATLTLSVSSSTTGISSFSVQILVSGS